MKRNLKKIFKNISIILQFCIILSTPVNSVQTSATLSLDNHVVDIQELSPAEQQFLSSDEGELKNLICDFYDQAKSHGFAERLPEPFLLCYALLKDNVVAVPKDDLFFALRSALFWLDNQLERTQQTRKPRVDASEEEPRAPRPDAPTQTNPNFPVGPGCSSCCDQSEILRLLGTIRARIGSIDECSCDGTILSILGDACTILGPCETISSGIKNILTCCNTTYTTLVNDFNETWTILAALTTPTITVNCDVSGVYTTLGNAGDILGKDATISGTLKDIKTCCSNLTATVLREFNETWTILAALTTPTVTVNCDLSGVYTTLGNAGNILGKDATISGTLKDIKTCCNNLTATVIRDFNETWTILANIQTNQNNTFTMLNAIQTCCSNLTATVLREFNETWTILAALTTSSCDLSGVYTTLGNAGNILGKDATISGTLKDIKTCCSNLTATVLREFNETWTILAALTTSSCDLSGVYTTLGNAGDILGKDATISGTLKDIKICCSNLTATVIRDFNETWTILANIQTNQNGTFTALNSIQTCCSNLTATVLREFNETWTILAGITTNQNNTFTMLNAIQTCCSNLTATVLREFNETWTILATLTTLTTGCDLSGVYTTLGNAGDILGKDATISGTLKDIKTCCNNLTATVIRDFNETWTILANIQTNQNGTFTALNSIQTCCSNLTATVLREFNETWTILAGITTNQNNTFTMLNAIQTCCSNLTATVLREFNETWTILATLTTLTTGCDLSGVYTTLGNAGDILGKDATISGTLKDIKTCCNNLTATVIRDFNETWTILTNIQTNQNNTFTMLNAIQTCCSNLTATVLREFNETWTILGRIDTDVTGIYTVLGNVGNILGANATISGTLLNIMQTTNALTATVIRDFNETWTQLSAIQTCCSNLTATVLREFNETWTILAEIDTDIDETFTVLNVLTTNECSPTLIRQSNVSVTTFTISQPGRYIFAEDISFAPSSPQRAIDITSSGVTLDLLCHTLTQTNSTSGVDGIRVASSLSNVVITHGTIQNFTRAGITVNSACSRITIDGVTLFSCNVRGMELLGASGSGNQVTESEITNCKLTSCCLGATGDIVLTLSRCTDVRVTNCRINQNGTTGHTLQAVRLDNTLKCELKDVEANDNLASTDFRGYELSQATYCIFRNCITKNNQASVDGSSNRGFMLESNTSCTANEFLDCSALNLTGTASVDGFLTDTGCNDNLFMRCEASFNSAQGTAATAIVHGFNVISNSRNIYIDCIARNNTAPNSTATPAPAFGAKGFDLNTCTACNLLRCLATDQSTGAGSTSVGIQVNQGSQCSIRDCQSSRHSIGYRLDPNNSTNHVFSRNFAGKNTTQYSQFPGGSTQNAAGINNINGSLNNPWSNVSVG